MALVGGGYCVRQLKSAEDCLRRMQLLKVFQVVRSSYIYSSFSPPLLSSSEIIAGAILLSTVLVLTFYAVIFCCLTWHSKCSPLKSFA